MLYFLYGNDTHKARTKLHELLSLAQKKRPEAELFKITTENWSEGQFDELLISRGLFEQKYTVVLDNLFEKKDIRDFILDKLEKLSESEQIFLSLEFKVDAPTLKKIEKHAKQVQEFAKAEKKKESGRVFSVANYLESKDKKNLWISYQDLVCKEVAPEEIHGVLFWKVKDMILKKASAYTKDELREMSSELVGLTHKVRIGEGDMEIMLEKWILDR